MDIFGIKGIDGKNTGLYILANSTINNAFMYIPSNLSTKRPIIMLGAEGPGPIYDKSYSYAIDVVGHEYTHGVLASKYKLSSEGKGKAIHEGMADYFGSIIEGKNWTMDIFQLILTVINSDQRCKKSS